MQVSNRVVDLVQEGVDVALRVRPTLDDSGSLIVKNLGNSQGLLVASPAQLERQGRPQSVEDLRRLSTVGDVGRRRHVPAGSCWGRAAASTSSSTVPATRPMTC